MIPWTIVLIALAVIYVVGCFLVELENFGWATLVLIVTGIAVQSLHVVNILAYVSQNLLSSAEWVAVYLTAGVVWSFVKWFSFLMNFRDKFRELKQEFLTKNLIAQSTTVVPEELQDAFEKHMRAQHSYGRYRDVKLGQKPTAAENKKRIIAWMAFWPCSLIGTVLNDPVRRIFKFLFNTFKALYEKMANWVFANDPELK